MGLFGSKSSVNPPVLGELSESDIQTIPGVFYGGNNPVIYEANQKEKTSSVSDAAGDRVSYPRKIEQPAAPLPLRKSRVLWILVAVGILGVGGVSAYYVNQYLSFQNVAIPSILKNTTSTQVQVVSSSTSSTSSTLVSTSSSTTLFAPTSTPSLTSNFLDFPPLNLGNTSDIDLDQLTDIEEALYSIDSGTWDTDGDGYYDGQEIVNLYNPKGFAPVKLIDSGLLREYVNPFSDYRIYYPIVWQRGGVDPEEKQVLFSSISGEYVEFRVFEKSPGTTFADWFKINAPQEQFSSLLQFTNRFLVLGWRRSDNLVVYFDTSTYVYVGIYHQPDSRAPIPYRSTFEMMYQSFRPSGNTNSIPLQVPLVTPSSSNNLNTSSMETSTMSVSS